MAVHVIANVAPGPPITVQTTCCNMHPRIHCAIIATASFVAQVAQAMGIHVCVPLGIQAMVDLATLRYHRKFENDPSLAEPGQLLPTTDHILRDLVRVRLELGPNLGGRPSDVVRCWQKLTKFGLTWVVFEVPRASRRREHARNPHSSACAMLRWSMLNLERRSPKHVGMQACNQTPPKFRSASHGVGSDSVGFG